MSTCRWRSKADARVAGTAEGNVDRQWREKAVLTRKADMCGFLRNTGDKRYDVTT
jgi:hypothetical protein